MLTTKQYLKRVFLSYWGVLIVLSPFIAAMFLVPDRPDLAGGGKDPRLIPFVMPLLIFLAACWWIGGDQPMTNGQKFKRVLLSRWGLLTVAATIVGLYVLSFFDAPTRQNIKDNPLLIFLVFLFLCCPTVPFWLGWEKFDEEDRMKRLEENPHLKKELKEGESLIDFLYENEHEEKM